MPIKRPAGTYRTRLMITFQGGGGQKIRRYIEMEAEKNHRNNSAQMIHMLEQAMKAEQTQSAEKYEREGVD